MEQRPSVSGVQYRAQHKRNGKKRKERRKNGAFPGNTGCFSGSRDLGRRVSPYEFLKKEFLENHDACKFITQEHEHACRLPMLVACMLPSLSACCHAYSWASAFA
jgi:hypothetical protein